MKHVTIKDVAKRANVGIATASRALNNKSDVSPETRQRVLEAAEALGYVPNLLARGLLSGRTKTVGVVVTSILNPFYAVVVSEIERVLSAKGYNLVLCNSNESSKTEFEAVRMLREQRVDGIIIAPVEEKSRTVQYLVDNQVPFTLVARNNPGVDTDYVVCDDKRIGELAADYLIKKGHRHILFLNSWRNSSAMLRLEGFRQRMEKAGISVPPELVRALRISDSIEEAVLSALRGRIKPTAIFCFCDVMALSVMRVLNDKNIKVPAEIAVMGCDNVAFTEFMNPPLTTMDIGKEEMGASRRNPSGKVEKAP